MVSGKADGSRGRRSSPFLPCHPGRAEGLRGSASSLVCGGEADGMG